MGYLHLIALTFKRLIELFFQSNTIIQIPIVSNQLNNKTINRIDVAILVGIQIFQL